MTEAEKTKLLEQIERWNDADEFSRCIQAIEAVPETERDYLLTLKLSRAYSHLAVLGDHRIHGKDGKVDMTPLSGTPLRCWNPSGPRGKQTLPGTPAWGIPL